MFIEYGHLGMIRSPVGRQKIVKTICMHMYACPNIIDLHKILLQSHPANADENRYADRFCSCRLILHLFCRSILLMQIDSAENMQIAFCKGVFWTPRLDKRMRLMGDQNSVIGLLDPDLQPL